MTASGRAIGLSSSGCVGRAPRAADAACCWCVSATTPRRSFRLHGIVSYTLERRLDLAQPEYTVRLDAVSIAGRQSACRQARGRCCNPMRWCCVRRRSSARPRRAWRWRRSTSPRGASSAMRCPTIRPSVTRWRGTSSASKASANAITRASFANAGLRERRAAFLAASVVWRRDQRRRAADARRHGLHLGRAGAPACAAHPRLAGPGRRERRARSARTSITSPR